MNIQFIDIKKAVDLTGKSLTTINRLVHKYEATKNIKKVNGKYVISLPFLESEYPMDIHLDKSEHEMDIHKTQTENVTFTDLLESKNQTIEILKTQVENQKNELEAKNKQINDLTETGKAQIFLIRDLQNKLELPERAQSSKSNETIIIHQKQNRPEYKNIVEHNRSMIIDLHKQGFNALQIATELNRQGITNAKGNKYNARTIYKVLHRIKE